MGIFSKYLYSPFFQNKAVLYGSLVLVLLAVVRFLANHNFNAIILMGLIGLLMSYFSKNMIIVLLTSFVAVVFLEFARGDMMIEGMTPKEKMRNVKEGAGESNDDETATATAAAEDTSNDKPEVEDAVEGTKVKDKPKTIEGDEGNNVTANSSTQNNSNAKNKTKQGMSTLSPADYTNSNGGASKGNGKGNGKSKDNRIDYANTLEQAYDNIENLIGEDGVRGLTDQTQSLMSKQKELMNNMKDMEPLLKSAQGFMTQLTGNGMDGIAGLLGNLTGGGGSKPKAPAPPAPTKP